MCKLCSASKGGILVEDIKYQCNLYDNMELWFSRMKKSLRKHLFQPLHKQSVKELEKETKSLIQNLTLSRKIQDTLFIAFLNFPVLLSTVSQCGLEIGNINHTRNFVSRIFPLIYGFQQENTKVWITDQPQISILLDVLALFWDLFFW